MDREEEAGTDEGRKNWVGGGMEMAEGHRRTGLDRMVGIERRAKMEEEMGLAVEPKENQPVKTLQLH